MFLGRYNRMLRPMSIAIIGVGSNLGSREASIRAAARLLDAHPALRLVAGSSLYETAALGPVQPDYLNAAIRLETELAPAELLAVLLTTERRLGRVRSPSHRWGPRSLDLDFLWDERGPVQTKSLRVPHPGLTERAFALGPLLDVAPELAPLYGSALRSLGGPPSAWSRAALLESSQEDPGRVRSVQADALVDAVALALAPSSRRCGSSTAGPRCTVHRVVPGEPGALAEACSALCSGGFSLDCVSVSDCSESQWKAQVHGTLIGSAAHAALRLQISPGTERAHRVLVL